MKFNDIPYQRPSHDEWIRQFDASLNVLRQSEQLDDHLLAISRINRLRDDWQTARQIVYIRNASNLRDSFYIEENSFFDQISPMISKRVSDYHTAILESPFLTELRKSYGGGLFTKATESKPPGMEVQETVRMIGTMTHKYQQTLATATVEFDGQRHTLSSLSQLPCPDRDAKRKVAEGHWRLLAHQSATIDELYDGLIKARTELAHKLGYRDFVEYSHHRRIGYSVEQLEALRQQVRDHMVPLAQRFHEHRRQREGMTRYSYYDTVSLKTGVPSAMGDEASIVQQVFTLLRQLPNEMSEFVNSMEDSDFLDLIPRPGKRSGAFCASLPNHKSAFLFANVTGARVGVKTLVHEMGHAFEIYCRRDHTVPETRYPRDDIAEIHSIGMELLTWPWMDRIFGSEAEKYRYLHMSELITSIPYGACVDEFEHAMYSQPNLTPRQRKEIWRELEKEYSPQVDYEGNSFLEEGTYWYQQQHIFTRPFYYISYPIAKIYALQLWQISQGDWTGAWQKYVSLCRAGGDVGEDVPLSTLGLYSPSTDGTVERISHVIGSWMGTVDEEGSR